MISVIEVLTDSEQLQLHASRYQTARSKNMIPVWFKNRSKDCTFDISCDEDSFMYDLFSWYV